MLEELDCPECGWATPFEVVDCTEQHGLDCPDRVCTGCGLVVVVGLAPIP